MLPKRNRNRSFTPAWLDMLIRRFEFIGLIGTILASADALLTLFGDGNTLPARVVSDD